jgi:hypothetical protein|tara:strand:- start:268 stop:465 length:198 start_codon:yes stop_codon:yes gene_type:complete
MNQPFDSHAKQEERRAIRLALFAIVVIIIGAAALTCDPEEHWSRQYIDDHCERCIQQGEPCCFSD